MRLTEFLGHRENEVDQVRCRWGPRRRLRALLKLAALDEEKTDGE
jgi:hypothetical protein